MWIPKTIYEHEAGLRYRKGKLVGVVGAGQYWYWSNTQEFVVIDMRPRAKIVGGQEVMARDGSTLKVSLLLSYRVADAKMYREAGGGAQTNNRPQHDALRMRGMARSLQVRRFMSMVLLTL